MSTPSPISNATHTPTATVKVGGNEILHSQVIFAIEVQKEVGRISKASILLHDGDPASQDFEASNLSGFEPNSEVEIQLGYATDEELVFKGIIV